MATFTIYHDASIARERLKCGTTSYDKFVQRTTKSRMREAEVISYLQFDGSANKTMNQKL
jgi:hypothetical protein